MCQSVTHPSKQWPTQPVRKVTGTRNRLGLVGAVASQNSIAVDVLAGGRVQPLEQGETSSLSLSGTEAQADEDLERVFNRESSSRR